MNAIEGHVGTTQLSIAVGRTRTTLINYTKSGLIPPGRPFSKAPRSPHVWTTHEAQLAKLRVEALDDYVRNTRALYDSTTKRYTCPACGRYTCGTPSPVHSHMRKCTKVIAHVLKQVSSVKAAETRKLHRLQQATPPQRPYTGSYKVEDIKKLLKGFVEGNITREDFHKAADAVRDHYQQITEEITALRGL